MAQRWNLWMKFIRARLLLTLQSLALRSTLSRWKSWKIYWTFRWGVQTISRTLFTILLAHCHRVEVAQLENFFPFLRELIGEKNANDERGNFIIFFSGISQWAGQRARVLHKNKHEKQHTTHARWQLELDEASWKFFAGDFHIFHRFSTSLILQTCAMCEKNKLEVNINRSAINLRMKPTFSLFLVPYRKGRISNFFTWHLRIFA